MAIQIFALSAALEGYMRRKLAIYEIIALIAGGLLMIYPGIVTDAIGFVLVAGIVFLQYINNSTAANKSVSKKQ